MSHPVMGVQERGLGYKFMAAEAAWILSGDNRVATIAQYSKQISRFSDDGEFFFGAYGPKIRDQLPYIMQTLARDVDSRQAVINIWREQPRQTKDVPCTISLQWLIRSNQLHCFDTMRSSDAWLGWPYDVFNMSMVSIYLLAALRRHHPQTFNQVTLGNLYLTAASQHLYEEQLTQAKLISRMNSHEVLPSKDFQLEIDAALTEDQLVGGLWNIANSSKDVAKQLLMEKPDASK